QGAGVPPPSARDAAESSTRLVSVRVVAAASGCLSRRQRFGPTAATTAPSLPEANLGVGGAVEGPTALGAPAALVGLERDVRTRPLAVGARGHGPVGVRVVDRH